MRFSGSDPTLVRMLHLVGFGWATISSAGQMFPAWRTPEQTGTPTGVSSRLGDKR